MCSRRLLAEAIDQPQIAKSPGQLTVERLAGIVTSSPGRCRAQLVGSRLKAPEVIEVLTARTLIDSWPSTVSGSSKLSDCNSIRACYMRVSRM